MKGTIASPRRSLGEGGSILAPDLVILNEVKDLTTGD